MDHAVIRSNVEWVLHDVDGRVVRQGRTGNLVTQIGDQLYGDRGAGVSGAPALPTGMKLGTGSTAASKTGAGAALASYLADSQQAFDSAPASSLSGSARRITYVTTWPAGKATSSGAITEAVIVNVALTDATSPASATIARAVLVGVGSKGSTQSLTITWTHDLMGA